MRIATFVQHNGWFISLCTYPLSNTKVLSRGVMLYETNFPHCTVLYKISWACDRGIWIRKSTQLTWKCLHGNILYIISENSVTR